MVLAARSSLRAAADVALIVAVALLTFFAGVATVILLPAAVLAGVFFLGAVANDASLYPLIWCLAAFVAAFYIMIRGVEEMGDPDWGRVASMVAVIAAVVVSCPLLWGI